MEPYDSKVEEYDDGRIVEKNNMTINDCVHAPGARKVIHIYKVIFVFEKKKELSKHTSCLVTKHHNLRSFRVNALHREDGRFSRRVIGGQTHIVLIVVVH